MATPSVSGVQLARLDGRGALGVFLISMSTLMLEIVITRIFSVTMWYHFAFVAISIAMLGLSTGAVIVYLLPGWFRPERAPAQMALFSLLFAVTTAASVAAHLGLQHWGEDPEAFRNLSFAIFSVPFVASGVAICLALTRFPAQLSRLYAFDLCGAALGCVLIILLLDSIGDVFSVIAFIASLSALSAWLFGSSGAKRGLAATSLVCALGFLAVFALLVARFGAGEPLARITWSKGAAEPEALFERWNSYSRIKIEGDPASEGLVLKIDGSAATALARFDGDLGAHQILKRQMDASAHYLRPESAVAVIGVGGGRDVLTSLVFGQRSVVGIEMNKDVVRALTEDFGEFTGHLDRRPGVEIVNDEARSYLARSPKKFDIIMARLIDTWAATAAGAFALTENSLYTVEAWVAFLESLSPRGVLSFTRWYTGEVPGEMYRMMSLAVESLEASGASDPGRHVAVFRRGIRGTIIVSKNPFRAKDLDLLETLGETKPYDLVYSPRRSTDPMFEKIASAESRETLFERFPLDITAPTDDSPFFFNMLKFGARPDEETMKRWGWSAIPANVEAVVILRSLAMGMAVIVALLIFLPLSFTRKRVDLGGAMPLLGFFGAIGLGFMLIEISQLQRLAIFLGHPTYSLSVVLLSLLLSSGLGSLSTGSISDSAPAGPGLLRMSLLLALLALFGVLTPYALHELRGAGMPMRILASVLLLSPMGFFMGMAFPIGMKLASRHSEMLTPWLWGVNGAMSVFASVLAVVLALVAGISAAFWAGAACYVVAVGALYLSLRSDRGRVAS